MIVGPTATRSLRALSYATITFRAMLRIKIYTNIKKKNREMIPRYVKYNAEGMM